MQPPRLDSDNQLDCGLIWYKSKLTECNEIIKKLKEKKTPVSDCLLFSDEFTMLSPLLPRLSVFSLSNEFAISTH